MTKINLQSVSVEFPVYDVSARSFKKNFLRMATGGAVVQDANKHILVNALKNITINIHHGDQIALLGHNGAGKSTFLKLLANIYEPTRGEMTIEGVVSPMLNLIQGIETELTGYENIIFRATLLGLKRSHIKKKIEEIISLSGLGDYLAMPVRTYSSGMMVRLAFAISTSIQPDILLIDEIFGAGDKDFMEKAMHKMASLVKNSSIVIIASHSESLLTQFCNKGILLEAGEIKYFGSIENALALYHSIQKH